MTIRESKTQSQGGATRLKGASPLLISFPIILRFVDATADQQLRGTDKTGREKAASGDDRFIGEIKRAGDKPAIPFSDFAVLRTPQIRHSIVVFTIGYRLFVSTLRDRRWIPSRAKVIARNSPRRSIHSTRAKNISYRIREFVPFFFIVLSISRLLVYNIYCDMISFYFLIA